VSSCRYPNEPCPRDARWRFISPGGGETTEVCDEDLFHLGYGLAVATGRDGARTAGLVLRLGPDGEPDVADPAKPR
jgi:hypothetical protein